MNKKLTIFGVAACGLAAVAGIGLLAPKAVSTTTIDQARNLASNAYARIAEISESQDSRGRNFVTANGITIPHVLSARDRGLYQQIFDLQKRGQWTAASRLQHQLSNPLLLGHVQAQRLLSKHYSADEAEMAVWLKHYGNLPQANRISKRAAQQDGKEIAILSGYGDDNGLHRQANPKSWNAGLNAWENKKYAEAAKHFAKAYEDDLRESDWSRSAAAYWAARAYRAAGDRTKTNDYLKLAAEFPRTFYGILALHNMGQKLATDRTAATLSKATLTKLMKNKTTQRAIALAEAGQPEMADLELRRLFMQMPAGHRQPLLALAAALDLPAVQITMARALQQANPENNYDVALYPQPNWAPEGGFRLDPALIYAFARQESGFRISAESSYGAVGLMQLMPRTAELVNRRTKLVASDELDDGTLREPSLNLTLGQSYLTHLMKMDRIGHNLMMVAAAYNAGPGKIRQWRRELDYSKDPLLFLERIPAAQTRHYVTQVMTNYWMYTALQGRRLPTAHALAQDRWPVYVSREAQPIRAADSSASDTPAL